MKIGNIGPFRPEDYPDVEGEWLPKLLSKLNRDFKGITNALQGQVSISDNTQGKLLNLDAKHNIELEVSLPGFKGKPIGAQLMWSDPTYGHANLTMENVDRNTVKLIVKWDTDPGVAVETRIMIFGG